MPDLRLGTEHIGAVAPYMIAFRRDLTIRALGPGWHRGDPAAREGQHLGDVVRFDRPTCAMAFDTLLDCLTSGASLLLVRGGLPLRGPLVRVNDDLLVFLGSIWITDPAHLSRFGLTLADLPHADREFLSALQTKQQATQAVTAQFAVTRVLATAISIEAAASDVVQALCEVVGWSFGAMWQVDRRDTQVLRCVGTWTREGHAPGFAEASRSFRFARGEGLPGRVWASGQAVWIEDVTRDPNFPRASLAARAGLCGAFALPIVIPNDAGSEVVGVIEAFGSQSRPPDEQVLAVMAALGSQVGQFLQRRRSVAALRESEERLRLIIDSAIDAVVVIDAAGVVRAWNPQAERTFGWTAQDAIGRELGELIVPPELREAHFAGMRRYRETGVGQVIGKRLELPAIDRTGRRFTVELSISPIHRADMRGADAERRAGWPVLFSGFLRDITQRLEAEAALRRAKEEAEAAAAAKTDFLAMMSHEIRTPMNAIIGLTGLLLDADLDAQQASYLRTVRDSGEALLTIINDILDFSKIEAGQLALERLVFAPVDLAGDVVDLFRPSAEGKGLSLTATVAPAVPRAVVSDPGRLRQVLNNLVGNAIKFTTAGAVTLTIDASPGGDALDISVRDTGVGIPNDVLPKLFRPFSQADSSMSRRYGGTGLGLAICDRLVRLMGGTVAVESVVGQGSLFRVRVPVEPAREDDRQSTPTARRELREPSPVAGKIRVLVVEDNPANQIVAVAMLRRLGIRADQASDGAEALAAVTRLPYDVVLMDCQMPDMDGYESARRIRALEIGGTFRRPTIIAMTANALKGERERCLDAGMDDYLPKPVRLAELAGMLEHWVPALRLTPERPVPGTQTSERVGSLREMLGDEWEETVQVFVSHGRETLALLADAARRGSAGDVHALAHLLRGGAGMMGAVALEALAAELEGVAAAGAAPAVWADRVEAITREFERVILEYR